MKTADRNDVEENTVDIHQAEMFLALAEELHFGRAAEKLNIAQPPLSRGIKQLERQLGAPLFERSTRHVALTEAGKALIDPAERLLRTSREAASVVRYTMRGELGSIKLGFAGASVNNAVSTLVREIRKRYPGLTLEFQSSNFSHTGLERVMEGSLDLAIGRWDFIPSDIESLTLVEEEAMVVLPIGHPLAELDSISMSQLSKEPWVVLPGGFGAALQNMLGTLAQAAKFAPKVVQTAPDSWTQIVLVGAGVGCALSLDTIRDNMVADGVKFLHLEDEGTSLEQKLVWAPSNRNPAVSVVVKTVQELYEGSDSQENQLTEQG